MLNTNEPRIKLNIREKLIFSFLFTSILPILIVGLISYFNYSKEMEKTVGKYSLQSVEQTMKNIDLTLNAIEQESIQIISSPKIQKELVKYNKMSILEKETLKREIVSLMRNIYNSRDNIINIILMLKDSNMFLPASMDDTLVDSEKYKESALYIEGLKANGNPVWFEGYVRKQSEGKIWSINNKTVIEFSRCIKNYMNMKKIGVLAIEVRENSIENLYKTLKVNDSESVMIINEKGKIISHTKKDLIGSICDDSFIPRNLGMESRSGYYAAVNDDKKVMVSYASSEVTGWKLIRVIPYDSITRKSREVGVFTISLALLFVAAAVVLSIVISFNISNPISKIVSSMHKIRKGDFTAKVNVENNDEIGFLGENFNEMADKISELFNNIKDEQKKKREAEFKALQAQISPHYLFNVLNSIKFYAASKKQNEMVNIIDYLITMLRSSFSMNELITVGEEIELVKMFVALQEFRFNIPINIFYEIDEELLKCKTLKFLIQPLVENSIIHGIDVFSSEGVIRVKIAKADGGMKIVVSDNGRGIEVIGTKQSKFTGFALSNIEERIKLFFGEEYGIKISSKVNEGTTIELFLPVLY